jgi:hypothetical protein
MLDAEGLPRVQSGARPPRLVALLLAALTTAKALQHEARHCPGFVVSWPLR